jgi:hypothetical protein
MKLKPVSFIVAAAWTAVMLFSVMYASGNEKFPVTYFQSTPNQEAVYKVDISPSLAWDKNDSVAIVWGYIFLAVMWASTIIVAADLHLGLLGKDKSKGVKSPLGIVLIFVPLVLSVIFFFLGHSSKLVSNSANVDEKTFNQWVADGNIEKLNGKEYRDHTGVLVNLFDKELIK